ARAKAMLLDVLGRPSAKANLEARDLASGGLSLASISTNVNGPLSRLSFDTTVEGLLDKRVLAAEARGQADVSTPTVRATIREAQAALDDAKIALNAPLRVTSRGGVLGLKGLDLSLPKGGSLAGDVTSYGGPISGGLRLSAPDLSFLKSLADIPLKRGGLDAALEFDTRRRLASGTISGRDVVFEGIDATGALSLDTRLDWEGRAANIDATITGDFGQPLRLSVQLPVASTALPSVAERGPVSAQVNWEGEIGDLWALVPAPGHVLTGTTKVDLGVSGDISAPQITGGIAVTDGGYQNLDAGTILTDLEITTNLAPGGDLGLSVNGSDGATGTVTTEGTVALDASGIDLTTTIDRAVLVRRDDILARLDGEIVVKGPTSGLNVTGQITIDEAEVRLVNANPPGIVELGDVLIKGQPEPEARDDSSSVTLSLVVNAPGRMFVRGRGLDSEWKMGLAIRGDAAKPRITGRIERVRGRLDLIGKAFDLSRGRIDFDGGTKIDPRVDVVLERQTSDLTGRIVVDGTASDPQLGFSSTPSLPEDEVLPRTIFGKSSQALTGSQAIQLALGLATLMDGGGGTLDSVRGAVGLDSLNVEQDADGNASVAAGKQVTEDIWVGTKQSLSGEGGTSVVVEIDILEDIQVEGEVEAGGSSSVGLQWKKDF
ncbi:MAG: translocation/assembly module TamB domain-containing protein, partial [Pseudomonadota bacterium]